MALFTRLRRPIRRDGKRQEDVQAHPRTDQRTHWTGKREAGWDHNRLERGGILSLCADAIPVESRSDILQNQCRILFHWSAPGHRNSPYASCCPTGVSFESYREINGTCWQTDALLK